MSSTARGRAGKYSKPKRGGGKHFSRDLQPINSKGEVESMWADPKDKADEDEDEDEEDDEDDDSSDDEDEDKSEMTREQRRAAAKARKEAAIAKNKNKTAAPGDLPPSDDDDEEEEDDADMPANPNHTAKARSQARAQVADPAAGPSDAASKTPASQLSRREREALQAQQARERYQKLHAEGKTDQARADLERLKLVRERREAEAARKKAEAEEREEAEKAKADQLAREQRLREAAAGGPKKTRGKKKFEVYKLTGLPQGYFFSESQHSRSTYRRMGRMRRQRLTQQNTCQSICLFCRSRLTTDFPRPPAQSPFKAPRRSINTSSPTSQQAATAAAQPDEQDEPVQKQDLSAIRPLGQWKPASAPETRLSAAEEAQRQAMRSSMGNAAPPAASTEQSTIVLSPQEQRERQALFAGMESRQMGMGTGVSWNRGGLAGSEGSRNSPRPVQTEGGLTPEEERQRNAMRARTDISFSRADGIGNRGTHAEGGGISWGHSREDTPGVVWGKQPVTRSAPVVRRVRINQPVHGSDEPSRQPNPDLASSWKHIRRVASAPTASAPFQEPQEFAPSASPDSRRSEYLRQRQQREQQAMRGEYVGLVADKPPPQCYRCGQIGHLARHCTKTMTFDFRDVPCHHCGRRGHAMAACPQLKPFQSLTPPGSTTSEPAAQPAAARAIKAGIYSEISASVGGSKPDVARTEGQDPRYQELADMERSYIKRPEMPQPDTERSVRLRLRRREARQSDPDELDEDLLMIEAERADERKRHQRKTERAKQKGPVTKTLQPLYLPEFITVANLATALRVRVDEFIHKMGDMGFESVRGDHVLNSEDAGLIVSEYGYEPIIDHAGNEEEEDLKARPEPDDTSLLPPRPPVVTIMGHVDHGKTTILDYLRKSSVAASEFGGITQHIGAFSVQLSSGKMITFLDTPGHAAFLSMRQRGATVTDIVVLVVAADDSVKPQTIEAIKHAQAAGVPIIVAINKIDKDEAAPDRVKNDLAVNGINVEDFGGDTQAVLVSGKTGQGVDQLEEAIVTLSEIQDHRADMEGPVEGWVLEAATKRAGRVATVLVRRGTLSPGDIIVAGTAWARVRQLRNEAGVAVDSAAPGTAVEVDGWREPPTAGDEVLQAPNEQKATAVVQLREKNEDRKRLAQDIEAINESRRLTQEKREQEKLAASGGSNEADAKPQQQAPTQATGSGRSEIPFIVKADVSGSAEAVLNAVSALGNGEIRANILRAGVGAPSEFDIEHASAAKGHIISFNTNLDSNILQMAEQRGVRILDHKIIYHLVDDVKACLSEHLPPLVTQRVTGEADVAQVFSITLEKRKQKQIAGSKVRNGQITKNSKARVLRGKEIVYDGVLTSLKNVKKDVTEMRKGTECGIAFQDWEAFEVGDQIQCYEEKSEKRYL